MNRYVHAGACEIIGLIKFGWLKLIRGKSFKCSMINLVSPGTEITLNRGGSLVIGKTFKMRNGSKLRIRKDGKLEIGDNFSMGDNSYITSYEKVVVGNNVQFGPGVKVYDQDHDFRVEGGLKAGKYKTSPVVIGNNVWIGADSIVLRGTSIGDNTVIGAGSIVKGMIPANSVFIQKRINKIIGGV